MGGWALFRNRGGQQAGSGELEIARTKWEKWGKSLEGEVKFKWTALLNASLAVVDGSISLLCFVSSSYCLCLVKNRHDVGWQQHKDLISSLVPAKDQRTCSNGRLGFGHTDLRIRAELFVIRVHSNSSTLTALQYCYTGALEGVWQQSKSQHSLVGFCRGFCSEVKKKKQGYWQKNLKKTNNNRNQCVLQLSCSHSLFTLALSDERSSRSILPPSAELWINASTQGLVGIVHQWEHCTVDTHAALTSACAHAYRSTKTSHQYLTAPLHWILDLLPSLCVCMFYELSALYAHN